MNNVSFWLTASGALLINLSLFIGEFARTGWLAFPPLSEKEFSPGSGSIIISWHCRYPASGRC
jgi:cytochrome o ubiquinol oxidase subunit 1